MPNNTVFLACSAAVIAAECAVALFVVYRKLSRVRHALLWSIAFAMLSLQWIMLAFSAGTGAIGLIGQLFGLASLLLFVESFRVRARGEWPGRRRVTAAAAIVILGALSDLLPLAVERRALLGVLSATLFAYAATRVVPAGKRASAAEIAAVTMLIAMALLRLLPLVAGRPDAQLEWLLHAGAMPTPTAAGLIVILLIASDFSIELARMLHTDPLTGLLNRAGFETAARSGLRRARPRSPVSVVIADIDHFKSVNDTHGHGVGDAALACIARHLARAAGRDDVVGRIGGEEFAMLLRATDGPAALARIDPIRAGLPAACAEDKLATAITASFGIAERAAGEDLPMLLDRADRALYRSKRDGRDRVTLATLSE